MPQISGINNVKKQTGPRDRQSQRKKHKLFLTHMDNELQLLELKDQIESKVRGDIEKQQRDYFLNQQVENDSGRIGTKPKRG